MKKRCILLVIIFFISIIILSVNSNNKYLVKEESLATFIDGEKTDSFPAKGTVVFSKAECDNNTKIYWDNDTWGLYVTNLSEKVKCNLYFKTLENAVTKITNLASTDTVNMATDDPDNNVRYIGANPNNYVYFNCDDYNNQTSDTCELWRIIGVFNNIEKEDGTKENLIKIVRNDSIGNNEWNFDNTNDWTTATLQKNLNDGEYYNKTLKNNNTRLAIETVTWNIGESSNYKNVTPNLFYEVERGANVINGNQVSWIGKIGLMYVSDYGYATSGGSINNREFCLSKELFNWNDFQDCYKNDYLYKSEEIQWTLTSYSGNNSLVFDISNAGHVHYYSANSSLKFRPALFLKSDIFIGVGDGSKSNPYRLNL